MDTFAEWVRVRTKIERFDARQLYKSSSGAKLDIAFIPKVTIMVGVHGCV